jgi:ABC-type lipoprotein release transport system permease subunit
MVLADGANDEIFSNLGFGDIARVERRTEVLQDADGQPLSSWEVYLLVTQPIPNAPPGGRRRRLLQIRGLDDPVRSSLVHQMPLHEGGAWFSDAGVQPLPGGTNGEQAGQAVLGEGIARDLGQDQGKSSLETGDVFAMGPGMWVVVGILRSAGSTFDSEVWAKKQLVGERFGKKTTTTIVLRTADADAAKRLSVDLTTHFTTPAVLAQPESEYYAKLNATNEQFLLATLFIASVIAVGGVFGVMNTMFAAISQRGKDIGVLRILGFARWQLLVSFFLETLLIALAGGVLGCALGAMANGWSAAGTVGAGPGSKSVVLKLAVDANILLAGVLFSLGMGCVGGLLPALSAMRCRPLESLR